MSAADSSGVVRIVKKVLVVEDLTGFQRPYRSFLRRLGETVGCQFEVHFATTVPEAENVFREHPDICGMILDGGLGPSRKYNEKKELQPDIEILLFLKHVRTRLPDLPIVASSSEQSRNVRLVREGCTTSALKEDAPTALFALLFPSPEAG